MRESAAIQLAEALTNIGLDCYTEDVGGGLVVVVVQASYGSAIVFGRDDITQYVTLKDWNDGNEAHRIINY